MGMMDDAIAETVKNNEFKKTNMKKLAARNKQIGGKHYKDCKIQPIDYIYANNLSYNLGSCLKYITRSKGDKKDRVVDLLKAKHFIDLELQMVYGTDAKGNNIGDYSVEVSL